MTLWKHPAAHVVALLFVVTAVYSNTLHAPFVFDDAHNITNNPTIRGWSYFLHPARVKELILNVDDISFNFKTRYISNLSFAMNYRFGGLDVTGYHVFNIGIHFINAVLLYWLGRLIFRTSHFRETRGESASLAIPFLAAMIFAAHPVSTSAVTYLTQRYASLTALFYLLSAALYIRARTNGAIVFYIGSILTGVVAMFTKENAVTLPLAIALCEFSLFAGDAKQRAKWLALPMLTIFTIPLTLYFDGRELLRGIGDQPFTRVEYLYTQFTVVIMYIRLLFVPVNQNLDYDIPIVHSFFDPAALACFIALLALFCFGVYCHVRSSGGGVLRMVSFGIFWFYLNLLIESSVFPIGVEIAFEHRAYLPSAGFFLSVAALGFIGADRVARSRPASRKLFAALAAAIIMGLAAMAYSRNGVWKSEVSLWEDVVSKSPNKKRTRIALGRSYEMEGRLAEAQKEYEAAVSIDPNYPEAHNNLGVIYAKNGDTAGALTEVSAAVRLFPAYVDAHNNLGTLLYHLKAPLEDVVREYRAALSINEYNPSAMMNLAGVYGNAGRYDEAEAAYNKVLKAYPENEVAREMLAKIAEKRRETAK